MPDSPDMRERRPNPQRKSCGLIIYPDKSGRGLNDTSCFFFLSLKIILVRSSVKSY